MKAPAGFGTMAIHAAQPPDPTTGAIMTPVYQTSTYVQSSPGQHRGYEYSRTRNPTRDALEGCIAALERGTHGLAFASGCAATATVLQLLAPGDKILCSDDVYGGTYRLFSQVFARYGLDCSFVDLTAAENLVASRFEGIKLVWLETPSNPLLKVIDIARVTRLAQERGAMVAVDNTFLTPYFQRPLELGADLVVHSTTKYLNGHSDTIGGAVVTNDAEIDARLRFLQNAVGAVPSPHDCFLVLRGIKTLHLRMQRHAQNAVALAELLEAHPRVARTIYPGLPSHPQYELSRRQSSGSGGMVSFVLDGDLQAAKIVLQAFRLFALAESLGGVESLVEHPATMTHASIEPEMRAKLGIADGLIRLSVGVEELKDLQVDLLGALDATRRP